MNRPALHYMRTIASPRASSSLRTWIAAPSDAPAASAITVVETESLPNPERGLGIPFIERSSASVAQVANPLGPVSFSPEIAVTPMQMVNAGNAVGMTKIGVIKRLFSKSS